MNWFKSFWKALNTPKASERTARDDTIMNFTPHAQQVLALARKEADRFQHNFVGTEHLLLGLTRVRESTAGTVLGKMGLDVETVRLQVEKQIGRGTDPKVFGNIPYTPPAKKVFALAVKEAKALKHTYVGTEHILLGLLERAMELPLGFCKTWVLTSRRRARTF